MAAPASKKEKKWRTTEEGFQTEGKVRVAATRRRLSCQTHPHDEERRGDAGRPPRGVLNKLGQRRELLDRNLAMRRGEGEAGTTEALASRFPFVARRRGESLPSFLPQHLIQARFFSNKRARHPKAVMKRLPFTKEHRGVQCFPSAFSGNPSAHDISSRPPLLPSSIPLVWFD